MASSSNIPRQVNMNTVGCICDHCKVSLDRYSNIWVWNEHFACSRDHVIQAQASTNRASTSVKEKDTDLL